MYYQKMFRTIFLLVLFVSTFCQSPVTYTIIPFDEPCQMDINLTDHLVKREYHYHTIEQAKDVIKETFSMDDECNVLEAHLGPMYVYQDFAKCCSGEKEYMIVYLSGRIDIQKNMIKF